MKVKNRAVLLVAVPMICVMIGLGCDEEGTSGSGGKIKSGRVENDGKFFFEPDREVYTIRFFAGEIPFSDLRGDLWRNKPLVKTLVPNLEFGDGILDYHSPIDLSNLPQLTAGEIYTGLVFFSSNENDDTQQGTLVFTMPPVLKIFSFQPLLGGAGTEVTILGINFSSDPDSHVVTFNNVPAEVLGVEGNELVAVVPEGATTGPIRIMIGERSYTGHDFTVTLHPGPLPFITAAVPDRGQIGDTIQIHGSGFDPDPLINEVRFAEPTVTEITVTPIAASLTVLTVLVPAGLSLGSTYQLSVDILDVSTNLIQFTIISGINVTTVAGSGIPGFLNGSLANSRFNSPTDVTSNQPDVLYVCDRLNHRIRKIDLVSGSVSTFSGQGTAGFADGASNEARFNNPQGIWVTPGGEVYVADTQNNRIRRVDPAGNATTIAGDGTAGFADGPAMNARFFGPTDVAVDASGNVYVADRANERIRKIDLAGTVTTLAGNGVSGLSDGTGGAAQFASPTSLTVDAAGSIYVADHDNNAIRKITASGIVTTLSGNGSPGFQDGPSSAALMNGPIGLAVHEATGVLYISDFWNHRIRALNLSSQMLSTVAGNGIGGFRDDDVIFAQLGGTFGLWVDPGGIIYFADQNVQRIRKIE